MALSIPPKCLATRVIHLGAFTDPLSARAIDPHLPSAQVAPIFRGGWRQLTSEVMVMDGDGCSCSQSKRTTVQVNDLVLLESVIGKHD